MVTYSLSGTVTLTPAQYIAGTSVRVNDDRIGGLGEKAELDIDLAGATVAPALINAHDHLLGNYWPKVGHGPYPTWREWDIDLKASDVYRERSKISNEDLYLIGSFRNLISGVGTVSDHVPHALNAPLIPKMPIRIIKDYTLAHEVSRYDLKWGDGVKKEHDRAQKNDIPFITHIEEGFDEESKRGIDRLIREKALSDHTVLVHGLALSATDIKAIAAAKAHLVWCPTSNMFMFDRTGDVRSWQKNGISVSLGTDSPMSGGINLLEELRFARDVYRTRYGAALSDRDIVSMVTENPAKALRLNGLGTLEKNAVADILVVNGADGYRSLVNAELRDIRLLIREGKPVYGDESCIPLFEHCSVPYNRIRVRGAAKVTAFDIRGLLSRVRTSVGYSKELPFLPIE